MDKETVLPVVDISLLESSCVQDRQLVAEQLDRACADTGFLYIRSSRLDAPLVSRLVAQAEAYFALGDDAKMRNYIGLSENHSGYVPAGEEQFGEGSDDLKEAYDINRDYRSAIGRNPLLGPNLWPERAGFRDEVQAYYRMMTDIGSLLFRGFAISLGLAENHFDAITDRSPSQLRLIHYPFDSSVRDRPGIGAHTDYECFTLLFATAPGLQIVDKASEWMDVPLLDGTLIMNIGDMMEIMSNGRYVATRHRVKKVPQERYSFAFFHSCNYDEVIAPVLTDEVPRYRPLRCGEHLFNQTAQTFAYLKRRIAQGDLVLTDAMPLDSFGRSSDTSK